MNIFAHVSFSFFFPVNPSKRKSERSVIHLHLCFAIAAAVGLFLGALKLTKIKVSYMQLAFTSV